MTPRERAEALLDEMWGNEDHYAPWLDEITSAIEAAVAEASRMRCVGRMDRCRNDAVLLYCRPCWEAHLYPEGGES